MLSKEEIEKAKSWLSALDVNSEFEAISKEILLSHIEELEFQNNVLQNEHKYNINRIKQLEFQLQAEKQAHDYDIKMINETKGEAVKLYKENNKLNKIIDEMSIMLEELKICHFKREDGGELLGKYRCYNKKDWKQYFEKKVEED